METSNFNKKNASKVFSIGNHFDYENIIEDIAKQIWAKSEDAGFDFQLRTLNSLSGLRLNQSMYICSVYVSRIIANVECMAQIHCFGRCVHANEVCLDYEFGHVVNSINFDNISQSKELFCEEADRHCLYNYGMVKIQSKNCEKWMKKQLKRMIDIVETVYEDFSISKHITVAILSNGEAIYEKC